VLKLLTFMGILSFLTQSHGGVPRTPHPNVSTAKLCLVSHALILISLNYTFLTFDRPEEDTLYSARNVGIR
jgi:hypothetical protein